jgi:hypothetical protein
MTADVFLALFFVCFNNNSSCLRAFLFLPMTTESKEPIFAIILQIATTMDFLRCQVCVVKSD